MNLVIGGLTNFSTLSKMVLDFQSFLRTPDIFSEHLTFVAVNSGYVPLIWHVEAPILEVCYLVWSYLGVFQVSFCY